jgi:hypothetical protein
VRSKNLVKPKKTKDDGDKKIIAQRKLPRRGDNMTWMRNNQLNEEGENNSCFG